MYKYDHYLVNEELRYIDPYSPDLTDKEKRLVILECKLNYSYFVNTIIFKNNKESLLMKIYINTIEGLNNDNT